MTAEISLSEVKKHKNSKSLWIVIHNDVYDVTSYLEEHPGGEEALLEVAGKDGTRNFEDVGHSEDARELMKKFKIGTLPASDKKKDVPKNWDSVPIPNTHNKNNALKWGLLVLAGAIIVAVALKKSGALG